jgi:hypothetical protein
MLTSQPLLGMIRNRPLGDLSTHAANGRSFEPSALRVWASCLPPASFRRGLLAVIACAFEGYLDGCAGVKALLAQAAEDLADFVLALRELVADFLAGGFGCLFHRLISLICYNMILAYTIKKVKGELLLKRYSPPSPFTGWMRSAADIG